MISPNFSIQLLFAYFFYTPICQWFSEQPPMTKTVFQIICVLFYPRATFSQFSRGGFICSSNRYEFSRRVYLFVEQICFFPGGSILYSNRHQFSRSLYFLIEQIFIPRTHIFKWRLSGFKIRCGVFIYLFIIYLFILITQARICFRINWQWVITDVGLHSECLPHISRQPPLKYRLI